MITEKNPRGAGRKKLPENEKSKGMMIHFSPSMLEFIKEQMEENEYKSVAEYIRSLVRNEMKALR